MSFSNGISELSLAALKRGCRHRQEQVYRQYSRCAWTLAVRMSGCEAQAWDAVHAGFVRAFDRVGQLRQADRFGAWFKRIIVNQVMDQMRGQQGFSSLSDRDVLLVAESVNDRLDLQQALSRLSPVDRCVVWLYDAEGFTHREIAELAGQSLSWSKSRLSRAHARLRNLLEDAPSSHLESASHDGE
ncbi:MAG: RNA polymerase sigma factor [Wenzhouxiangella sp.]